MRGLVGYNTDRPHQALDANQPTVPADRFAPVTGRELLPLWLPPTIATPAMLHRDQQGVDQAPTQRAGSGAVLVPAVVDWSGGPVEFDAAVPPSGNMSVAGRQFWLGPARAGLTVRFWADLQVIHLCIGGARIKSVTSHLTVADLARLVTTHQAVAAGPPPIPSRPDEPAEGEAVEVDRVISPAATFAFGGKILTASTLLAGRQVGIRIEPTVLMLFDLETRTLLRTQPNPLTPAQVFRLRGLRPAGPPPRPSLEPVTVQRLADASGTICVARQRIGCGRAFARQTLTAHVSERPLPSSSATVTPTPFAGPRPRRSLRSNPGRHGRLQKPSPAVAHQLAQKRSASTVTSQAAACPATAAYGVPK